MALVFIDGLELRAAEIRAIFGAGPGGETARSVLQGGGDIVAEIVVESLQSGFSTSAPEPAQRARDKLLAHPNAVGCFAEAVDLTTLDGKSLRLELDSENENRFCKWWRETAVRMQLVVALRRTPGADIELFSATCPGRIADRPAGPHALGWDRLFVPDGEDATLAQLIEAGEPSALRREAYGAVARALGAPGAPGAPGAHS